MADTNRAELFDEELARYEEANPEWKTNSSYSSYTALVEWYEKEHSEKEKREASDFAYYVWSNTFGEYFPDMSVHKQNDIGFVLRDMRESDLRDLLSMIRGAGLQERRTFDKVRRQIEKILEQER